MYGWKWIHWWKLTGLLCGVVLRSYLQVHQMELDSLSRQMKESKRNSRLVRNMSLDAAEMADVLKTLTQLTCDITSLKHTHYRF